MAVSRLLQLLLVGQDVRHLWGYLDNAIYQRDDFDISDLMLAERRADHLLGLSRAYKSDGLIQSEGKSRLADVLKSAGIQNKAVEVVFYGADQGEDVKRPPRLRTATRVN